MTTKTSQLNLWLQKNKQKSESIQQCLMRTLTNTKLTDDFINLIISNPRENKANFRYIVNTIKDTNARNRWQKKYTLRYEKWIHQKWQDANQIEDILKIMPNFSPWALHDRFGTIKIGQLPNEFSDSKTYHAFLEKIHASKVMQNYRQFKTLECHPTALLKKYPAPKNFDWFDLTKRSQFLSNILKKIVGHTFTIKHNKHSYAIQYLCNPFSSKMVFRVHSDTKKNYILKMSAHQIKTIGSDFDRKMAENQAIRADSPYSNALMEFYLKLNNCPHAPDILYYTETDDAVLYLEQKGTTLSDKAKPVFKTFNEKYLKDANRLGIYVNDVSPKNFIKDKTGKLKIIDIGHATFANPMTPGIPGLTFTFGNLCGQDYLLHFGVLSMED